MDQKETLWKKQMERSITFFKTHKKQSAAAGCMLGAGIGLGAAALQPSRPQAAAVPVAETEPETETASAPEPTEAPEPETSPEDSLPQLPSLEELNLAYVFPEDADPSDKTASQAGRAFKILMTRDENWISGVYDYADMTPAQLAQRLGKPQSSVLGGYNPKDDRHDPNDPSTWTVNSFKDIRMTAEDGDGNPISPYSNVLDIMAMANTYTYYQDPDDYDLFLTYAQSLWEASHSYRVGLSDVYYCSGCLSEEAEQKAMEALEEEAIAEELARQESQENQESLEDMAGEGGGDPGSGVSSERETSSGHTDAGPDAAGQTVSEQVNPRQAVSGQAASGQAPAEQAVSGQAAAGMAEADTSSEAESVSATVLAGAQSARMAAEAAETSAETEPVPESTSAVIVAGGSDQAAQPPAETVQTAPEGPGGTDGTDGADEDAASGLAEETMSSAQTPTETDGTASASGEGSASADPQALTATRSDAEPADAHTARTADPAAGAGSAASDPSGGGCPGHVDLIVYMRITGIDGSEQNLFSIDAVGNSEKNQNKNGWSGWTEENQAAARSLSEQDWFEKYGLSVSTISSGNPLTPAEIDAYMAELPAGLSQERQDIIRFALNSVGKVPYYWGGKPSSSGYEKNRFGLLTTPDYKGRVLKGLDCSGWINWVFWSVTGERLPYESTAGLAVLGRKVSRKDLQPGDIILRTGTEAHVIMFLGWTADGRIQCIHESSGSTNNVTVGVRDANWPYYSNPID